VDGLDALFLRDLLSDLVLVFDGFLHGELLHLLVEGAVFAVKLTRLVVQWRCNLSLLDVFVGESLVEAALSLQELRNGFLVLLILSISEELSAIRLMLFHLLESYVLY